MKKLISIALAAALLFSLTACGGPGKKVKKEGNEKTKTEKNAEKGTVSVEKLMKNKDVRLAFAYGFNKKYITDTILGNGSKPVDFLVPLGLAIGPDGKDFRNKDPKGFIHYDVKKAKEHWAKAKKDLGFDKVEVEFLTYEHESGKKVAEYIQGQLTENLDGLTLKIKPQPFKQKIQLAKKGEFQFEFAGWGPDYPDPMTFLDMWVTGNGHNTAGYNSKEYDKLIEDSKTGELSSKDKERWEALQKAEKLLLEDGVIIPIYQKGVSVLEKGHLKGLQRHMFGCSLTFKHATTTKETDGKKIIRLLASGNVPNLDNSKATDTVSFQILGNVLEGLTMLGEGDKLIPGLADKWEVSEDKKTYTFHIRKDANWSNGEPVTAEDFVTSWRRLADKKTGSQYQFMIETAQIKNFKDVMSGKKKLEELGVKAKDAKTLVVELEQPLPFFLKLMSFPNFYPINKKFLAAQGENFGKTGKNLLYCGAYSIKEIKNGYGYSIVKNPKYYDAKNVKNDGVTYRIVKDVASGVNLYEKGDVDQAGLTAEYVDQFKDRPDFKEYGDTAVFYIVLNVGNKGTTK